MVENQNQIMILILRSKSCPSLYGTTVCLRSRVTGNRKLTHYRTTACLRNRVTGNRKLTHYRTTVCMRSRVTGNKKNWFIILPQLASGAELLGIENWTDFGTEWEISNLDTCSVWSPYSLLGIIEDVDGIHGQRSVPGKKRHRNEVRRLCPSPSHGNSQENYTSAMPCQLRLSLQLSLCKFQSAVRPIHFEQRDSCRLWRFSQTQSSNSLTWSSSIQWKL